MQKDWPLGKQMSWRNTGQRKEERETKEEDEQQGVYTHVRAIFKDLEEDEKDKFLEEAQNAGFKKKN